MLSINRGQPPEGGGFGGFVANTAFYRLGLRQHTAYFMLRNIRLRAELPACRLVHDCPHVTARTTARARLESEADRKFAVENFTNLPTRTAES